MPHSYENYDDKSSTYTALRRPLGVEEIGKYIQFPGFCDKDYSNGEFNLLDSGCGTGNYTSALLAGVIAAYGDKGAKLTVKIHCSDFNGSMVKECKRNVLKVFSPNNNDAQEGGKDSTKSSDDLDFSPLSHSPPSNPNLQLNVSFSTDNCCDMANIPSGAYDAVINNQVVHHLRPDDDFADLRSACKEWNRVLKSGGRFSCNWSQPVGQRIGMWWAELISDAMGVWEKRAPTVTTFGDGLTTAGFQKDSMVFKPFYDEILYDPKVYNDYNLFVNDFEYYRRQDSTFNLVSDEEKGRVIGFIKGKIEDGTIEQWMEKKNWERRQVGQTICVWAIK